MQKWQGRSTLSHREHDDRDTCCCVQVTNWSGTCYIFPLLGAFIADSYLGRYNTIIIFSILYIIVRLHALHAMLTHTLPISNKLPNGIQ